MEPTIVETIVQTGLGGAVFFALWMLLKWMMRLHDKVMEDTKAERAEWQRVISEVRAGLDKHTEQASKFHDIVTDSHKFQKDEHLEMIRTLQYIQKEIAKCSIAPAVRQ